MPDGQLGLTPTWTQDEINALREIARRVLGSPVNREDSLPSAHQWEDYYGPEVYIAKAPAGGIPALTAGSGSGSGSYDMPGSATCDIYCIDETDTAPDLREISLDQTVYNLSGTAIAASQYISVHRDKFGHWIAAHTAAASSIAIATAQVDEAAGVEWNDATFGIDNFGMIQGTNPEDDDPTEATNFLAIPAEDDADVILFWNGLDAWLAIPAHYSSLCANPCDLDTGTP